MKKMLLLFSLFTTASYGMEPVSLDPQLEALLDLEKEVDLNQAELHRRQLQVIEQEKQDIVREVRNNIKKWND